MHVAPTELRTLRQDGIVVRFALFDRMAFVLAEIPSAGSAGTSVEAPCIKPHWAFVIDGELTFESGSRHQTVRAGSAFHVPAGGPPHRFRTAGSARLAGFEPIEEGLDISDSTLAERGFEILDNDSIPEATVIPATLEPMSTPSRIEARSWEMSHLVLTEARFGPSSGYTSDWCDAPHWGLVTSGRVAIEYEHDLEIVAAGDVFHTPVGPPGHRIEAVEPASLIDLTPSQSLGADRRLAYWRRHPGVREPDPSEPIAVAGLG
jgi:quercetin dioxygenase-like cupin family protein